MNELDKRRGLLATGSVTGALLASSCCIVPLVLISLGVSGAWIGQLSALEPFKPYFLGITIILLGAGFWNAYFKKSELCEDEAYCARPSANRLTKAALRIASILVLLAATIDYWAPLFY